MKVDDRKVEMGVFLLAVLVCSFVAIYLYGIGRENHGENRLATSAGRTYLLVNPVFVESTTDATFLEEEAGISIYMYIGRSIDLAVAKTVYRTIEKETSNYTVGSVPLPDLPESEDVHCFVHKDGWIVVYYLKAEPVGKIIDWNYWSGDKLSKNKLQVGLEQMGNAVGVSVVGAKYYHFQYPNANKCMLIIETLVGTGEYTEDSFDITIPLEFTVYERSWSHHAEYSYYASYFEIDEETIDSISSTEPATKYGQLALAQLSPSVVHTVSVRGRYHGYLYGVCIALVYQEP